MSFSHDSCRCPSYEELSYSQIIEVSGLLKRKNQSKNCCEEAGYVCPTLDKALRLASVKRDIQIRSKRVSDTKSPSVSRTKKVLRKKKLRV